MDRTLTWIRDNPQFAALGFGVIVLGFVLTLLAVMMARAGASLRPLVWFGGFIAIVAGPQAVVHLLDGFVLRRAATNEKSEPVTEPRVASGSADVLVPVAWSTVFGDDADPALITDAKRGLAAILNSAEEAKLSFNRNGESALAARFSSLAAAAKALNAYGTFFAFADAHGSDAQGWTARRFGGQGEWNHVVTAGPELYAWTSATRESVIARRERALGRIADQAVETPAPKTGSSPELVSQRLTSKVGLMAGIVSLNLIAAVGWFFKGSAWAARVDATNAVRPATEQSLVQDLLALNRRDIPMDVTQRPDGTLEINWRYADARWFDLMRVHQMKRTQRLVLHFDEASHTVRVREFWSAFDASLGAGDLRLNWQINTGIQFFAIEHQRVFGAQLDADGRPTGELSKSYTFNLQALKAPFIEAVTAAGWRWQPLTWNAPASLRWLTE